MGIDRLRGKRLIAAASCLSVAGVLTFSSAAFAAGSGYTPPAGAPAPGGTASGLAGTVVFTTTIQLSGGTGTATIGTSTITVTVPAGAFPNPTQLVLTDANGSTATPPAGTSPVVTFGVGFYANGAKVTGTFPAVTITVTSASIQAGATVDFLVGTSLQPVTGATVTAGSATFTISSDPVVEIATPPAATTTGVSTGGSGSTAGTTSGSTTTGGVATGSSSTSGSTTTGGVGTGSSSTPIAGATTAQTGKPFLLEGGLAGLLVLAGGLLLIGLRLRRRPA